MAGNTKRKADESTGKKQKASSGNKSVKKVTASDGRKTQRSSRDTERKPSVKAEIVVASPGVDNSSDRKPKENSIGNRIMPYILIGIAFFIVVCYFTYDFKTAGMDITKNNIIGPVGGVICLLSFGLFSGASVAIPFLLVNMAVFWKKDTKECNRLVKFFLSILCLMLLSVLIHTCVYGGKMEALTFHVKTLFLDGLRWHGGGAVGGLLAGLLLSSIGLAGTLIITICLILVTAMFLFGLTPRAIWIYIRFALYKRREKKKMLEKERQEEKKKYYGHFYTDSEGPEERQSGQVVLSETEIYNSVQESGKNEFAENMRANEEYFQEPFEADIALEEKSEKISEDTEQITLQQETIDGTEKIKPVKVAAGESHDNASLMDQLNSIFDSTDKEKPAVSTLGSEQAEAELEMLIKRATVSDAEKEKAKKDGEAIDKKGNAICQDIVKPTYVFPPITLLYHEQPPSSVDISTELQTTAVKLVDTLNSFRVRTKIVNVSRGPAITRYELAPEEGIRVRSIANLVDDIALNLATTGVRIEAPIPGKAAVGIEVPNKVISTVYLRDMLEDTRFSQAQSRLTVALGVDVAGAPVYTNITKMPHMLIAGATGMGKSVCINSMIMSLLYKATPDEVKLILIDPKKVELNVYNGLPHLLIPVVSDPKKAAGSLHWAVTEMERRFELIEEVGVRDIAGYNKITANDPEREFIPQIVIIIDEFADLMMTAPDDVEDSVCRLAQKARAAGMHLIIGTQRPSVDVITGLIKANVPSRIAFTVASQIDSRTIIDISGAEKLIGRGDMLYAPVGAAKPVRVQGSFVSEKEVEKVVDFIKQHAGSPDYDSSVIESIEKEASRCGNKKGASASYNEEGEESTAEDPKLYEAIEIAVEAGKISTSYIQRRLSLGYGRAAKLIDRMEKMGIVSAPEGMKPRSVLINRQQYMEMVLKKDSNSEGTEL